VRLLTLLTVSLLAGTASADTSKLSFEVVRLLPETNQALVFDRGHNTHVLLTAGATFEDYVVVEISGVGLTLQKQQERFTVHPIAAKGLALDLEPKKNALPVIYSNQKPTPGPAQVAAAPKVAPPKAESPKVATRTDSKTRLGADLASLLTDTKPRAQSPSHAAKLKP
jgi:hypothetical protein